VRRIWLGLSGGGRSSFAFANFDLGAAIAITVPRKDRGKPKIGLEGALSSVGDRRYKAFAPFWIALTRVRQMTTKSAYRQREWRARRRASRRQSCACCAQVFVPGRADAAFCCLACAQRAYRRRKPTGVEGPRRAPEPPWRVSAPLGPGNTGTTPEADPGRPHGSARERFDASALIG
jgi:hypothetical protein